VQSQVWPGFPSDLTSIATAVATQAEGTVLIHEWMYPGRMYWVGSLESMGARIILCDPHRVVVVGPSQLYGSDLRSPDIRAGMALLAATLSAKGTSTINNVEQIDRGYEELDKRLRALGAKINLSSRNRTAIVHSHNGKSLKVELTREEFETMTKHLVEKCKAICEIVMGEARMPWTQVNKILLVGGMTRMPMVREMISKLASVPLAEDVNPDEAVAVGAAIQAVLSLLNEEETTGEKMLPSETRQQFSSREGGLIQVRNITSHTLGVVLWDEAHLEEYVFPMIKKMTAMPAVAKNSFGTATANMQRAIVRIVEGESTLPQECTPLGICDVELPPFLPKGSPVELTYEYNANQVLEVAVEACGNCASVSIERKTGLSEAELDRATAALGQLSVV